MSPRAPAVGVLEWFVPGEHERVERVVAGLEELRVEHLRTGISWADCQAAGGLDWYDWLLPRLAQRFEVLPCVAFTPPSLGIAPWPASPPLRPRDYADFLDVLLTRYSFLESVELWNEPNNLSDWDWTIDSDWSLFCEMVGAAAFWVRRRGRKAVLGGMSPFDPAWLALMGERAVLDHVDVVGIHGFPGTWEVDWDGWHATVGAVEEVLDRFGSSAAVWITETGFSTWRGDEEGQVAAFAETLGAPVERFYWYAAEDLAAGRNTADGSHADERDYHLGVRRADGTPKLLCRLWRERGLERLRFETRARLETAVGR
jgi:CDP-paratose 2-epimerase